MKQSFGMAQHDIDNEYLCWLISTRFKGIVNVLKPVVMGKVLGHGKSILIPWLHGAATTKVATVRKDRKQALSIALYDAVTGQMDRADANILTHHGRLWLIDHELSLPRDRASDTAIRNEQIDILKHDARLYGMSSKLTDGRMLLPEHRAILIQVGADNGLHEAITNRLGIYHTVGMVSRVNRMLNTNQYLCRKQWLQLYK